MEITKELVEYVATLSKIKVDDAFSEKMQKELGAVINYMEILNQVDTKDVEPLSHVFSINNVLREDEVMPSHNRAELIKNAPQHGETTFIVPKAVE
ncbi:MAG: Asp-tRNA(Asn)/Glu-tRNA(Gln) amidotransferase subunit GatC [Ruminococcaceae bacterium]|nr:Asp-tRNA(Asn)/Glu-tRNA(Gln) amidotransferase subunit GatC [Oscillospiraceae bacterium]